MVLFSQEKAKMKAYQETDNQVAKQMFFWVSCLHLFLKDLVLALFFSTLISLFTLFRWELASPRRPGSRQKQREWIIKIVLPTRISNQRVGITAGTRSLHFRLGKLILFSDLLVSHVSCRFGPFYRQTSSIEGEHWK